MKRQPKLLTPPSTQSGFTLIESLLAIMIVSILMVGIAPVIVLSVATRVQARRVELGTQAARTYIDGVRSGKITIPKDTVTLDEIGATDPITKEQKFKPDRDKFAQVSPPPALAITDCDATTARGNPNYPHYCRNTPRLSLYCVDIDGDGVCKNSSSTDLIVQAFRSVDANATDDDGSKGYLLGVRVYRADAFDGNTNLQTTQEKAGKKIATYTGGRGDRRGPLIEMTTEIRGNATNYDGFCDRLGGCPK